MCAKLLRSVDLSCNLLCSELRCSLLICFNFSMFITACGNTSSGLISSNFLCILLVLSKLNVFMILPIVVSAKIESDFFLFFNLGCRLEKS